MIKIILQFLLLAFIFPIYNVGDTVSNADQNVILNVCDGTSEYNMGDEIKLSDWDGATNGGDYHVIWLELSASW